MGMNERKPLWKNPEGGNDFVTNRGILDADIRAVKAEGEDKTKCFELSFSSEEPYMRWYGKEILDHTAGAVDLSRLKSMGVVLFNHNTNKVIGKVTKAWIEDGRGKAIIEFDDDAEAEVIRKKVESGTLRGVSVGYKVDKWEHVLEGAKSKDGRFKGECYIAIRWTALEISIVSVPADSSVGVGRSMDEDGGLEVYKRLYQYNVNRVKAAEKTAPTCI